MRLDNKSTGSRWFDAENEVPELVSSDDDVPEDIAEMIEYDDAIKNSTLRRKVSKIKKPTQRQTKAAKFMEPMSCKDACCQEAECEKVPAQSDARMTLTSRWESIPIAGPTVILTGKSANTIGDISVGCCTKDGFCSAPICETCDGGVTWVEPTGADSSDDEEDRLYSHKRQSLSVEEMSKQAQVAISHIERVQQHKNGVEAREKSQQSSLHANGRRNDMNMSLCPIYDRPMMGVFAVEGELVWAKISVAVDSGACAHVTPNEVFGVEAMESALSKANST